MLNMFKNWWKDDRAVIAIEVGFLFPTMLTLLLGVMDIGNGVYINQKLIDADQMIADLLTRNPTVSASTDNVAICDHTFWRGYRGDRIYQFTDQSGGRVARYGQYGGKPVGPGRCQRLGQCAGRRHCRDDGLYLYAVLYRRTYRVYLSDAGNRFCARA